MIKSGFFILCVLFGLLSVSAAVPGEVRGRLADAASGDPVAGAVVQALSGSGRPLSFGSSGADGFFRLTVREGVDSVSFRCLGYEPLKLPVSADFSIVKLRPKATELKDVIIEAPDIYARGDTLVFNVGRYATAEDNAIIDVIKRLPGIKVEDDGTIMYQGKPINKFYIDGNDFIGGQYGLATNNISHKDVKSVEVMENHQPVKALEGIEFPEEAGINLKLKEDARSRWVGVAQAAAGVQPALYDGSLFTMRIAPKMQNMFTLKADNTGWNPATQITEHDFYDMFSSDYSESVWPEYISADIVTAPLTEKRTRDNLSWLANGIAAWKSGDTSMRLKLNYMGDRLDYNSGVTTDYFSTDIPTFRQHNSQHSDNHDLSARFNAEVNTRGYYLKDRFTLNAVCDNSRSVISGSFDLTQQVSRKSLSAMNDLKLVKCDDKRLFVLTSRNEFRHRPDRLVVSESEDAVQNVGLTDFRSTSETQFGRMTRFWKFYTTVGVDFDFHRMNTRLRGLANYDNSKIYDSFMSNIYLTPKIDYERSGWLLSLRLPVRWSHQSVEGRHDYFTVSPRFYAKRQLTSKSDVSASAVYSMDAPQPYLHINAPVLSDYRNLFIGRTDGRYSQNVSVSVSYRYRNPLKALFLNASATYSYRRATMMSNQIFIEDFIVTTYTHRLSHSSNWMFKGGFSKSLCHSRMTVGCDVSASLSSASSMRDGSPVGYRQSVLALKPYFRGSLIKWLSANYQADYNVSRMKLSDERSSSQALSQNLSIAVIPHDCVTVTFGAEHFLTRFTGGDISNFILLDASAAWNMNKKIRLSLTANNLLNKRDYRYTNYGTLCYSEYSFQLRQRSILATLQFRF